MRRFLVLLVLAFSGCGGDELRALDNRPPVARLDCVSRAAVNDPVAFNGAASSDPDGDPLTLAWTFGDGAAADGTSVSHTFTAVGSYEVVLFVTDSAGATATTAATVSIEIPNEPPVAVITAPLSLGVAAAGSFDAGLSTDADGSIAAYAWDFGDGTTATTTVASKSYATAGSYTVRLVVTDNQGGMDDDTMTVTVTATPPSYNGTWSWGLVDPSTADGGFFCGTFYASVLGITVTGTAIQIIENPGTNNVRYSGTLDGTQFSALNTGLLGMQQTIAGIFTSATHFDGTYRIQSTGCDLSRDVKGDKQ
ncbi:MAG: PKD domain-containing protein [Deltaproteobacteria bacterium]|nr:PKD domain-containing protein [Deltaproteobacteria bacterium]